MSSTGQNPRPLDTLDQQSQWLQNRYHYPNNDITETLKHNIPAVPIMDFLSKGRSFTNEHQMFFDLFYQVSPSAPKIIKSEIINEKNDFITKLVLPLQEVDILAWESDIWYTEFSIADDLPVQSLPRQITTHSEKEEIRLQRKGQEVKFTQSELRNKFGATLVKARFEQLLINLHSTMYFTGLFALFYSHPTKTIFTDLFGDPTVSDYSVVLKRRSQYYGIGSKREPGEKIPFQRIISQAQSVITNRGQRPAEVLILPPGADRMLDYIQKPEPVEGYIYEPNNPTPKRITQLNTLFTTATGVKAFIAQTPNLHENQVGLSKNLNVLLTKSVVTEFYRMTSIHGMSLDVERDPHDKDIQIYDLAADEWRTIRFCDALINSGIIQEKAMKLSGPTDDPRGLGHPTYGFSSSFKSVIGKTDHNLFTRWDEQTQTYRLIESLGQMDQKFVGEGLRTTADHISKKFSVKYFHGVESSGGCVSPSSAIVQGLDIRRKIADQEYEKEYFEALVEANKFEGYITPEHVIKRYRNGVEFAVEEWNQNQYGTMLFPEPSISPFNSKYPPGAVNFCNLRELASKSLEPQSHWHNLGTQLKPFVQTMNELSQMILTMLPHSKLIKKSAIPAFIHSDDPVNALAGVFLYPPPLWISPNTTGGTSTRVTNPSHSQILEEMFPENYKDQLKQLLDKLGTKRDEFSKKVLKELEEDKDFNVFAFTYLLNSQKDPINFENEDFWRKQKTASTTIKTAGEASSTLKKKKQGRSDIVLPHPSGVDTQVLTRNNLTTTSPRRTSFSVTPGLTRSTTKINNEKIVYFSDESRLNLTYFLDAQDFIVNEHPSVKHFGSHIDITDVYKGIHGVKFVENIKDDTESKFPSSDLRSRYASSFLRKPSVESNQGAPSGRNRSSPFDPIENLSDYGFGSSVSSGGSDDPFGEANSGGDWLKKNFIGAKFTLHQIKNLHSKNVAERLDDKVIRNLKLAERCHDEVTRIILLALIATEKPADSLVHLCKEGIYIPIDILLFRPQMVLEMLAAILCGENIGKTYLSDQNIYPEFKNGVFHVQFNFYTSSYVEEKKRVVVFSDAFHHDVFSGCSTEFFNIFTQNALLDGFTDRARKKHSLVAMPIGALSNLTDEILYLSQGRHENPQYPKIETGFFFDSFLQFSKIATTIKAKDRFSMAGSIDYIAQTGDRRRWNPKTATWVYEKGNGPLGGKMSNGCLEKFQGLVPFTYTATAIGY